MPANRFVLKHHQVEVDYTIGLAPGIPALVYDDHRLAAKSFTYAEITTTQTPLGTLVSVPLERTIDTGGEVFGFFLPHLDVSLGESEEFATAGVYERFSGPDSVPHLPPSWRAVDFRGTALSVEVPL